MKSARNVPLSIMTWNIYQGADFTPLFTTNTPEEIPERVTQVFRQFLATNFPKRAKAIARQIILKEPDILGLQEAVRWELIPPNSNIVEYDFIDILIDELARRGLKYRVAVFNQNTSAELPDNSGNVIRFTDRDAILVREESHVDVIRRRADNFEADLDVKIGGPNGQAVKILRGWSAIDACVKGHMFRVVSTHLEPLSSQVQAEQADELLAGPGNTELPLIFIGDFNSNANGSGTPTYGNLIAAGFNDTWLIANEGDGFTCCQDADLLNARSLLTERIDLILIKNKDKWKVIKAELAGEAQSDRTSSRLWPSDHAGVVTEFKLLK